jgi:hypothetical protein
VYKLLNDMEAFKELFRAQQDLERQAKTYADEATPSLDRQIRLSQLSEAQQLVRQEMEKLKGRLRDHADEIQEDYPKVAQDARTIAGEIESRHIEGLMDSAAARRGAGQAYEGHGDARGAREQMEAMIQFVKQGGGAGSQCELRLRIQMGLNPGNTLGQLCKSMRPGFGLGQGLGMGAGSGESSSATPFDVYGSETPTGRPDRESPAGGRRVHDAQAQAGASGLLAGSIEEAPESAPPPPDTVAEGGERFMEEYRALIEAYFKRAAEEE